MGEKKKYRGRGSVEKEEKRKRRGERVWRKRESVEEKRKCRGKRESVEY